MRPHHAPLRLLCLVVVSLALPHALAVADEQQDVQALIERLKSKGVSAYKKGDYAAAGTFLTEAADCMVELAEAITQLPQEHRESLEPMLNRVLDSTRRRRRILHLVQDALSQLRLDMKYLVFDLEATRRERDELRESTEDHETGDE